MLRWAVAFLGLAIIAAVLGFGGIASTSAGMARTLFYLFLVISILTCFYHLMTGKKVV